jgi:hypothetical protein
LAPEKLPFKTRSKVSAVRKVANPSCAFADRLAANANPATITMETNTITQRALLMDPHSPRHARACSAHPSSFEMDCRVKPGNDDRDWRSRE